MVYSVNTSIRNITFWSTSLNIVDHLMADDIGCRETWTSSRKSRPSIKSADFATVEYFVVLLSYTPTMRKWISLAFVPSLLRTFTTVMNSIFWHFAYWYGICHGSDLCHHWGDNVSGSRITPSVEHSPCKRGVPGSSPLWLHIFLTLWHLHVHSWMAVNIKLTKVYTAQKWWRNLKLFYELI